MMLWSMLTYVLLTMTWLQSSSWVMVVGDDANDYGTQTLMVCRTITGGDDHSSYLAVQLCMSESILSSTSLPRY